MNLLKPIIWSALPMVINLSAIASAQEGIMYPPTCSVVWDAVEGATNYTLSVDGAEYSTTETAVACGNVGMVGGTYVLMVNASNDVQTSEYSAPLTALIGQLGAPTNIRLEVVAE